jgi:hypothetical protein
MSLFVTHSENKSNTYFRQISLPSDKGANVDSLEFLYGMLGDVISLAKIKDNSLELEELEARYNLLERIHQEEVEYYCTN